MKNIALWLCLSWVGVGFSVRGADCTSLVVNALDAGWYDAAGNHSSANDNYFCGDGGGTTPPLRNWFVFNIPTITQSVASVVLSIRAAGIEIPGAGEAYELHQVTTPTASLRAGGSGLTGIYADLGDGPVYGSRTFLQQDMNQLVSISLNATFISSLTAASGGTLALGGHLASLDGIAGNPEFLFGSSSLGNFTNAAVQLVVTFSNTSPLTIVEEPASLALMTGDGASFQVRVCGGGAPSYQWQRSGTNLPGATGPFFQKLNLVPADSGTYRVLVTESALTVTSAVATLTVSSGITPTGLLYFAYGQSPAVVGESVTLCFSRFGNPVPELQWQLNGTNLPAQTANCIYLPNIQPNQAGNYRIVASNVAGVFTSAPISLVVTQVAPSGYIYFSSGQSLAPAGSYVQLCGSIFAGPPPSYQWQFNGANLPGKITPCLDLFNVASNQAGLYRLVASNTVGVFTSAPLSLAVSFSVPEGYVYFSSGQTPAPAGSYVRLCSFISGAPPPQYQWQFNGANMPGQNGVCLDLPNVSSNQAGLYRLIATNFLGGITTAPIALTVDYQAPAGDIYLSGVLSPLLAGSSLTICSSINGAPYPDYQWQFNGVNLPGQNSSCLYLYDAQTNQSGNYRLIASNVLGVVTSSVAVVSVVYGRPTASIYLSSGHTPATVGGSLWLCASVSGAPFPSLQWQFNGTNLTAETGSCLYLSNLQTNQGGAYTVVASNIAGVVTSTVANITVTEPVPVLAYFASGIPPMVVGSFQYLCAAVSLPEAPALQWRFNGTNIDGATDWCHFINPLEPGDAGIYDVVATTTNSGSYTSPPVALTVYFAPPHSASPYFLLGSSSALVGEDIALGAFYSGSPAFVQWRFNGVDLPGETNSSLTMLSVTTNQAGLYSFTATNIAGTTTSSVAALTVRYQIPSFVNHPNSLSVVEGISARFQAYAPAGPPADYFLEQNGTNVAVPYTFEGCCGVNAGGFSLLDTTFADAGNYRLVASNFLGMATSAVATLTVTPAGPLDRWTQRNPLPQSQPLFAVAHGTNQFVAVGDRGTILTSPDGSNWSLQNRRADQALNGVAYGDGLFVAVGTGGTILSSSDGTNWAYRFTAAGTTLNAVTHAAGRFVVVGSAAGVSTLVLHSTDGIHWDRIPLNGFYAQQAVAYGNGRFVAAGTTSILVSTNGTNWSLVQNVSRQVEGITYAAGLYVAVGDDGSTLVSVDGAAWFPRTALTTRRLLGVAYGAGRFVAAGARGTMLTSTDSITWSAVPSGTPDRLETIDFADGIFVAAGENGTIITSTNGTSWTKQNFGITRDLDGMHVANGRLVVVGKGGSILTSTDGVHYETPDAGVTNDLHGITWGGDLWVAVGEPGIVLTSSNAVDWTSRASGNTNSLKDATYAAGQWIIVGTQGTIVRSTDGVNWSTSFTNPGYDLNDVAYGNGMFLVAGDGLYGINGSLFQSLDGLLWTQAGFYPGKNLRGITFADGQFVITANDSVIFTTSNALSFGSRFPFGGYNYGRNLRAVTRAHDLWIVVGNQGTIVTSPDLVTWTRRASRTFENQHQVALLDGRLVVIGNRGTVLQSGRFATEWEPPVFAAAGFRLPFKGVLNRTYQIQASFNLVNWTNLLTFTNHAEASEFTDTNAFQHPLRFYRLVEP